MMVRLGLAAFSSLNQGASVRKWIWDRADQPACACEICSLKEAAICSVADDYLDPLGPEPVDQGLPLLDDKKRYALLLHGHGNMPPDAAIADEDGVSAQRGRRELRSSVCRSRRSKWRSMRIRRPSTPAALLQPSPSMVERHKEERINEDL